MLQVKAIHPYIAENTDELTFNTGEMISVIEYEDPEEQVGTTIMTKLCIVSQYM